MHVAKVQKIMDSLICLFIYSLCANSQQCIVIYLLSNNYSLWSSLNMYTFPPKREELLNPGVSSRSHRRSHLTLADWTIGGTMGR